MEITEKKPNTTHEQVLVGRDAASGYHGIIAIHSTSLGPAVGGTRFWNYSSEEEALTDVLRLSHGMTYKTALAGLPLGGGKSIIIGNNTTGNREALLRTHGRFVDTLKGRYITAEDVGTTPADMDLSVSRRNTLPVFSAAQVIPRRIPRGECFVQFKRQPDICGRPMSCAD